MKTSTYTGGVADTSIQAYWEERLNFRMGKQAAAVLDNLYLFGPATRAELVQRCGLKINVVCARVRELFIAGCLEQSEKVLDEGTLKQVWRVKMKEVL